jgi:mannose-6-phosphate isomerase class I
MMNQHGKSAHLSNIIFCFKNRTFFVYSNFVAFLCVTLSDRERKCARAVLRLAQQFPGDPGAMAPLFLNYLLIAPGESFFMAANEPHAYVAGEIIECMACSDNVVSTKDVLIP